MGEEEFRSLYEKLSAKIFSYAARRLPPEVAKDVVSETFEVVWVKHLEIPHDSDAAAAWVFGVAKNKVLQANQQRTRKHHDHRFVEDYRQPENAVGDIADLVVETALGEWVYNQLNDSERALLDIAFIRDIDRGTAAAVLGLNIGAFNTRVSRLRSRIIELTRTYDGPSRVEGANR